MASGARPIFSSVNRSGAFQVVLELMLPVAPIDTGGEFLGHPTTGQKTSVAARPVQIGLRALGSLSISNRVVLYHSRVGWPTPESYCVVSGRLFH